LGERLCLDFVNTIESPRDHPHEFLYAYSDLIRWGRHVRLLGDAETADLIRGGEQQPDEAAVVFQRAIDLRAVLTRIFRAIAHGDAADEGDLQYLQTAYLDALRYARLALTNEGYKWESDERRPDYLLGVIAQSAVDVLIGNDMTRIKECPGAGDCGWLFYDTSKNNSRRWCSMEGCGSRVKMRRQYARSRRGDVRDKSS
jgi:predicted RNA-binding Zn ribbon-like protein